jgi:glycosyltransferase involved in cell wall biosynthesis
MKIIYVLHRFLPRFFSGTEIYTYYLAQEMQRRGHEAQIFCAEEVKKGPDCKIIVQEDNYNGLKVHRINFNRDKTPNIIQFSYNNPLVADHFKSFLSSAKPDLVHITSFLNLSAAIIDPIKKFSIPAIFTATDYWCFCPKGNLLACDGSLCKSTDVKTCLSCLMSLSPLYDQILKKLMIPPPLLAETFMLLEKIPAIKRNKFIKGPQALNERSPFILKKLINLDLIITPTPHLQEFFLRAGFSPEKVMLSGYGLNLDWIKPYSSHFSEQPLRFGYIGMLAQLKGVDILIRAFNSLPSTKRAGLKIYGDDSHFPLYAQKLKKLARDNPTVTFSGTFSPDKRGEVLAEIDVLVVPSMWYENAPLVISEAFAAGVPVIGSDVPGIALVVKDGVNGLLFPRGDEKDLTRCLARLLQEPDLLPRLRKNVPAVKSIQENGNELEEIYYKLIKNQTKIAPTMT